MLRFLATLAWGVVVLVQLVSAEDPLDAPSSVDVSLGVDHATRVYFDGESIRLRVRSNQAGYLYLFYTDASDKHLCLYPNSLQADNRIAADETLRIPAAAAEFELRVAQPFGIETLEAIVTTQPLPGFDLAAFTKSPATPITTEKLKGVYVEAKQLADTTRSRESPAQENSAPDATKLAFEWGSQSLTMTTRPIASDGQSPEIELPTAGLFVGVGQYVDPQIPASEVPPRDAGEFSKFMLQQGFIKDSIVLTDAQATLTAIATTISTTLVDRTRPGDTVLIYWSGHSARQRDDSESDGFSEYLIPYDGRLDERLNMLSDSQLADLVSRLKDRQVLLIFDLCGGGGEAGERIKSTETSVDGFRRHLFDRTKGTSGLGTALLASTHARGVFIEQKSGGISVMTHILMERLAAGKEPLTFASAAEYVCSRVPEFVAQTFPGTTQQTLFIDQTHRSVLIRP